MASKKAEPVEPVEEQDATEPEPEAVEPVRTRWVYDGAEVRVYHAHGELKTGDVVEVEGEDPPDHRFVAEADYEAPLPDGQHPLENQYHTHRRLKDAPNTNPPPVEPDGSPVATPEA